MNETTCHAWQSIPGAGVNLCTLRSGHRGNHLDVPHNVSWPVSTDKQWPHVDQTRCGLTREDFGDETGPCADGGMPDEHPSSTDRQVTA